MMGWGRFEGFTASSCGGCHKTANVVNGTAGWFCVCGHFNVLPWTGFIIPHEKPDLGPSSNKIQSAYSRAKLGGENVGNG